MRTWPGELGTKGGLLVDIGVHVFLPASQVDIRRPSDIGDYIGRTVQCIVLKIDEARRNIVVSRRALIEAEREIFGFSHQEAGALLSEKWNFPKIYSKSIRLHHTQPPASLTRIDREDLPQYAVYAGNQLAKELGLGKSLDPRAGFIPSYFWEMLGVPYDMLPELRDTIKEEFDDMINSWEQV